MLGWTTKIHNECGFGLLKVHSNYGIDLLKYIINVAFCAKLHNESGVDLLIIKLDLTY